MAIRRVLLLLVLLILSNGVSASPLSRWQRVQKSLQEAGQAWLPRLTATLALGGALLLTVPKVTAQEQADEVWTAVDADASAAQPAIFYLLADQGDDKFLFHFA